MSNFVWDVLALEDIKTGDEIPIPGGSNPAHFFSYGDWNGHRQALLDVQDAINNLENLHMESQAGDLVAPAASSINVYARPGANGDMLAIQYPDGLIVPIADRLGVSAPQNSIDVGLAQQSGPPSVQAGTVKLYADNAGNVLNRFPDTTIAKFADEAGAYDITARGMVTAGAYHGLAEQGSAPSATVGVAKAFAGTDGKLSVVFGDGTKKVIADKSVLVYNVRDFGAKGDGSTFDATAIQAALDAVTSVSGTNPDTGSAVVLFPAGHYIIDKPLTATAAVSQTLYGVSEGVVHLRGHDPLYGPVLYVGKPMFDGHKIPLVSSPLGAGLAWQTTIANNNWLNLSHIEGLEIDGLAALSETYQLTTTAVSGAASDILSACFGVDIGDGSTNQSGLYIHFTGIGAPGGKFSILAILMTSAGTYALNTDSTSTYFNIGDNHEISCQYDGSDFALYAGISGGTITRVAHTAATGTVKRKHWHEKTLGQFSPKYPSSNGNFDNFQGKMSSFHLTNNRTQSGTTYSSSTSKPTATANSLLLLTFDTPLDRQFVVGNNRNAFPVYLTTFYGAGAIEDVHNGNKHLRNLFLDNGRGPSLVYEALLTSSFENLYLLGYAPLCGWGNSYDVAMRNVHLEAGTSGTNKPNQVMWFSNGANSICTMDHIWMTGGKTGFASGGGGGGMMNQVFHQPSSDLVIGTFLTLEPNSIMTWKQFGVDGEGTWPNFVAGMYLDGGRTLSFEDCAFEYLPATSDVPMFIVKNPSTLAFERPSFTAASAMVTKLFKFIGSATPSTPPECVTIHNPQQVQSPAIPWTDSGNMDRMHVAYDALRGYADFGATDTEIEVSLPFNLPDGKYRVRNITVEEKTGTPATKSAKVKQGTKDGTSFTLVVDAAPGTSNAARVYWEAGY